MEPNKTKMCCFLFFWALPIFALAQGAEKASLVPTNYKLTITTSESHFKSTNSDPFQGEVIIDLKKTTTTITDEKLLVELNIDPEMEILKAELEGSPPNFVTPGVKKTDKIVFELKKTNYDSSLTFNIKVSYKNKFGEDMTGFYRSSYEVDGEKGSKEKRWLLTTHFEPIYARKAFPCFDKPNLKADYEITVKVPRNLKEYSVLSNTPCKSDELKSADLFTVFKCEKTPTVISSYLVAFTVSDFKHTEERTFESGFGKLPKLRKLKTYGQKNLVPLGNLSQNAAEEAINHLTKYLGIGYAYQKIDQVGIPDFTAGAMENWGLISYRENKLFFNESAGSKIAMQGNVLTITHELVHQWFGNLVTPETWDNIWLNEAFATYLQYLIGSQTKKPDTSKWDLLQQLVVNEIHLRAFEADGSVFSKHLSHKIEKEDLIFSFFNDISYSKGAAVLRMWDLSLKDKEFQMSLQEYLKQKQGSSVNPSDLYNAFKKCTKSPETFFSSWVDQAGYPVVEVKKVNNTYVLNQTRFYWEKPSKESDLIWTLPITYTTDNTTKDWKTELQALMDKKSHTLEKVNSKWIIVNNQQAGYYRVNYERENWKALSDALKKNVSDIHEINRAQIINDIFSLARSLQKNYVEYDIALELAKYLSRENSFVAWKTALNAFEFLRTKLYKDAKTYQNFENYVLGLVKEKFKSLAVQNSSHTDTLMAVEISRWACSLNYEPCVKSALELYDKSASLFDTHEIILCTAVRRSKKAWNETMERYKNTTDNSLKIMYLSVLGCTDDTEFLKIYLNYTLQENSIVRKQDFFYVLSSVYKGNLKSVNIAFEFVRNNYEKIAKTYGGINPLGRALVDIAKKLNSEEELKEMEELSKKFKDDLGPAKDSINTAISIIKSNIQWAKTKKPVVANYLNAGSLASYSYVLLSVCLAFIFRS